MESELHGVEGEGPKAVNDPVDDVQLSVVNPDPVITNDPHPAVIEPIPSPAGGGISHLEPLAKLETGLAHDDMARKKGPSRKIAPSKGPGRLPTRPPGRPRASKIDEWDVTHLTTSPESRLVHADLVKILADPETWSHFTKEELDEIGSKFPESVPRNDDGSISTQFLRYDNDWRHGVRQWQDDLGAGRLDPEWQKQAAAAVAERAAGQFDKFKQDEFEQFWGQKQKMAWNHRAGECAALKLGDLIAANLFKKGDYWLYSRVRVCGSDRVEVVKDCKIEDIGVEDGTLTFAIPPGTLRHARKINQDNAQEAGGEGSSVGPGEEDIVRYTISSVRMLESKIVELDGRAPDNQRTSAWRNFRCQRDNQDLGSLYEVREQYFDLTHRE